MELRAFAEAVLFGGELDSKLCTPEHFTDNSPGSAIAVPRVPGRPVGLELVSSRAIPAAPTPTSIENETVRGLALHTFAHHELQAFELMALALLRFPDAPTSFRRGLAKIICDEQRHFRLYLDRAEHWGVGLGDAGVGHFFWDTVAHIDEPAAFLAALSLTYEQANLDFAMYWKAAFAAIDDHKTVDVLHEVYEDEIKHVRHGLAWFERFSTGCDFETYEKSLVFPLSPGRAKGPIFDRRGRERVGFSPDFIDEIEIRNVSRGRPPRLFTFDPFIEEHLAGRTPVARARHVQQDLSSILMFAAHREDVVIAQRPRLSTLRRLHRQGFEIPQFAPSVEALGDRVLGDQHPWGSPEYPELYSKLWSLQQRFDFAEEHSHELLLQPTGVRCETFSDAADYVGGNFIAKSPMSASGQHRILLDHPGAEKWLHQNLAQGPVLIEPWYKRLLDLSVQVQVGETGVQTLGITRFWASSTGSYRGALIGHWTRGLAPEIARVVHGGVGKGIVHNALVEAGEFVGNRVRAVGYRGPIGVDAMLVQTDEGPRLMPILEVNPRYTMGRLALAIRKRCGQQGCWFFVSTRDIAAAGYSSHSAFIEAVEETDGVMFTTEPTTATAMFTVLSLGKTWQEAVDAWCALGFSPPPLCR